MLNCWSRSDYLLGRGQVYYRGDTVRIRFKYNRLSKIFLSNISESLNISYSLPLFFPRNTPVDCLFYMRTLYSRSRMMSFFCSAGGWSCLRIEAIASSWQPHRLVRAMPIVKDECQSITRMSKIRLLKARFSVKLNGLADIFSADCRLLVALVWAGRKG